MNSGHILQAFKSGDSLTEGPSEDSQIYLGKDEDNEELFPSRFSL